MARSTFRWSIISRRAIGNVFEVVHASGGIFGGFDTLSLPAIANGRGWAIVYTSFSVFLNVQSAPLLGDYNQNGVVDAADYTVWRDTLGSTTDLRANGDNTGPAPAKLIRPITTSGSPTSAITLVAVRVQLPPCPSRPLCGYSSPES